jgi:hypothetical protein
MVFIGGEIVQRPTEELSCQLSFVVPRYPVTLKAGETADIGIDYYTVEGSNALNIRFIVSENIVTVHGAARTPTLEHHLRDCGH